MLDRFPRREVQRGRIRAAGLAAFLDRPPRANRPAERHRDCGQACLALRRAICRLLGDSNLLRFENRAWAGDGGAGRRRWRRKLCRLPALQARLLREPSAEARAPRAAPDDLRAAGTLVSRAGLGATRISREGHLSKPFARAARRLLPFGFLFPAGG